MCAKGVKKLRADAALQAKKRKTAAGITSSKPRKDWTRVSSGDIFVIAYAVSDKQLEVVGNGKIAVPADATDATWTNCWLLDCC
jgi:hypothetical protein